MSRNVLSYYSMLRTAPAGKYNVQVCTNISCMLRGGFELLDHCKHTLGIGHKQTTPDGPLLARRSRVPSAPAAGPPPSRSTTTSTTTLTPEKMDAVLDNYRRKEQS